MGIERDHMIRWNTIQWSTKLYQNSSNEESVCSKQACHVQKSKLWKKISFFSKIYTIREKFSQFILLSILVFLSLKVSLQSFLFLSWLVSPTFLQVWNRSSCKIDFGYCKILAFYYFFIFFFCLRENMRDEKYLQKSIL